MTRLILTLTFLGAFFFNAFTQDKEANYFEPIPGGIVDANDHEREFVVIEVPGVDSITIFNTLKREFIGIYPETEIILEEPGSFLRFSATIPEHIGLRKYDFDFNFDIDIQNGRYRFYFSDISISRDRKDSFDRTITENVIFDIDKRSALLSVISETYLWRKNGTVRSFNLLNAITAEVNKIGDMADIRGKINHSDDW